MEQDEFARRVLAALPRVVRRQLDQAAAGRIAQLLQGMHVDARALPDDTQLAYIERAGRSRGPLPQSALEMFIEPGESYRLQGSQAWEIWLQPPEHEETAAPAPAMDEAEVAPVDEPPAEAPADRIEDEAHAPAAGTRPPVAPPPLPTEPSPPEAPAATPDDPLTPDDALTADDALINPPEDDPAAAKEPAAPPGTVRASAAVAGARGGGRVGLSALDGRHARRRYAAAGTGRPRVAAGDRHHQRTRADNLGRGSPGCQHLHDGGGRQLDAGTGGFHPGLRRHGGAARGGLDHHRASRRIQYGRRHGIQYGAGRGRQRATGPRG